MQFSESYADGRYVAAIVKNSLVVRGLPDLDIVLSTALPADFVSKATFLRWSPLVSSRLNHSSSPSTPTMTHPSFRSLSGKDIFYHSHEYSPRVLLADDETIRAWDVRNSRWTAEINAATGSIGKIAAVDFGRTAEEILVFSEGGIKLNVWSLLTARSVEIKDPKFTSRGYGYRPQTGHFALLTRPAANDVVTLHHPSTFRLINAITVPSSDAQGLKWSRDGRWLAVWDSPSNGCKAYIYTADGNLYKTYTGEQSAAQGMGIRSLEWGSNGDHLAIGNHDRRITLLSSYTFSPAVTLDHGNTIKVAGLAVYEEIIDPDGSRRYGVAQQPLNPPSVAPTEAAKPGISIMTFNNDDGKLLAAKCESNPTTLWVWSLKTISPVAILVQHSPIKSVSWHPTIGELLMFQCTSDPNVLYFWHAQWESPTIVTAPLEKPIGKSEVRWVRTEPPFTPTPGSDRGFSAHLDRLPSIIYGDSREFRIGYLEEPVSTFGSYRTLEPISSESNLAGDYFTDANGNGHTNDTHRGAALRAYQSR